MDTMENKRHPHYGPCNQFDDGYCSECLNEIERLREALEPFANPKNWGIGSRIDINGEGDLSTNGVFYTYEGFKPWTTPRRCLLREALKGGE